MKPAKFHNPNYPTVMYHAGGHVVPRVLTPEAEEDLAAKGYSRNHPGLKVSLFSGAHSPELQEETPAGDDEEPAEEYFAPDAAGIDPEPEAKERVCGNCGKPGHNARTCKE